jgi:hypothetical protein
MKLAKGAEGGFIMRSGSKRLMIGMGTFLIAAALTAPSFAAKKAVSDDELDMVTAAGQPVIVNIGGTGTVSFSGTTSIAQVLQPSSQTGLRALILNNVVGENQVQNGVNISATFGNGSQTNTITQSWGSILDLTATTVANGITSVPADCAGALICKVSGSFVTTAGTVRVLSKAADVIINITGNGNVTYNPTTDIAQDISNDSQTNLVALIVNNVAGLNQVANGINIGSSTGTLGPDLVLGAGGGVATGAQGNTIQQYRGTPINFR